MADGLASSFSLNSTLFWNESESMDDLNNTSVTVTPHDNNDDTTNSIILLFTIVLTFVLFCFALYMISITFKSRKVKALSAKCIEDRYTTVERWLINKRVRAHDSSCPCKFINGTSFPDPESAVSVTDSIQPVVSAVSVDDENDSHSHGNEDSSIGLMCPICMAAFQSGDVVSYSMSNCTHYYHHACIKEWLVRHVECPTCRQTFLPVDTTRVAQGFTKKEGKLKQLAIDREKIVHFSFVCDVSGLVVLGDDDGSIAHQIQTDWITRECPSVKKDHLRTLRGVARDP